MATIGQILKEARLKKNVTPSQAAAATRMKVQHIDALEHDDFKRMAAPTYVKGFIKLYAEYLDLDPMPLLRQYADQLNAVQAAPKKTSFLKAPPAPPKEPEAQPEEEEREAEKPQSKVPSISIPWPQIMAFYGHWKKVIWTVGAVLLVVVVLVTAFSGREKAPASTAPRPLAPLKGNEPALVEEPPEPYIETPNGTAPKP
jgi:cytoskeletal protein RodZ